EPSNEMTLWNYCVGEATPRQEHKDHLLAQAQRWRSLLLAGTGPHQRGTDARIRITGTASSSGDAEANQQLALQRAQQVRDLLVTAGVPNMLFDVVSLDSRFPLADESDPNPTRRAENMARNRRVEVTFYVPTKAVDSLGLTPAETPVVTNLRFVRNNRTHFVMGQDAISMTVGVRRQDATAANPSVAGAGAVGQVSNVPRGVSVGFLQLLTDDFRSSTYHPVPDPVPLGGPGARQLVVDMSPCVRPFLPCRDVEESTHRFSFDAPGSVVNGNVASSGRVGVADSPGQVWTRRHRDSSGGRWEFQRGVWSMKFVVLLGAFRGELGLRPGAMQILQHARWEFFVEVDPLLGTPRLVTAGDDSFQPGAPSGLDLQAATTGQTCRMILRSANLEDPTEGERPCRGRESIGPRPPI
ncbi:MAG TPA: OmpA family protein, partial [Pyrinomonadaceae bacterium]|nr:OmpA family protein [Pyrinomonadaceae bacterium]